VLEYKEKLKDIPIEKRYFLDECGINKELIREYGYSQKGQEINDKKSGKRHSNTTIVAFCNKKTKDGKYKLVEPKYQKMPMNTDLFCDYLSEVLPKLPTHSYLIWDNVAFHKSKKVVELVAKFGHKILCLSPYSPDQNPIEHLWKPLKNQISNAAKTIANFYDRITSSFEVMT
jgi:transposase